MFHLAALFTFVNYKKLSVFFNYPHRTHHSFAGVCAVAWHDVNMLTVKTFGTVVGISGSGNKDAAITALKILFFLLEGYGHS